MLTGDKLETAENIGYSCKMFNDQTKMQRINNLEPDQIEPFLQKMEADMQRHPSVRQTKPTMNNGLIKGLMTNAELDQYRETIDNTCREQVKTRNYGLVIEGNIFYTIFTNP